MCELSITGAANMQTSAAQVGITRRYKTKQKSVRWRSVQVK